MYYQLNYDETGLDGLSDERELSIIAFGFTRNKLSALNITQSQSWQQSRI
jgi:hypothetical protein